MLTFVDEVMHEDAIAAVHAEGEDVIVMLNSRVTDPAIRCDAVNGLLARLPASLARLCRQVA